MFAPDTAGSRSPAKQCGRRRVVASSGHPPRDAARTTRRLTAMPNGTVKWFNDDKGFGFITPDESGKDLFVHHSAIVADGFRSLPEGARVEYDAEAGDKGPQAVNLQRPCRADPPLPRPASRRRARHPLMTPIGRSRTTRAAKP